MQSFKNATLQFGLVNVPVGLATTATEKKIEFRSLHRECNTPKQQRFFCPTCDKNVEAEECVHGYEFLKNAFMTIEEAELDGVLAVRDPVIHISKFVTPDTIDPLSVKQTYYLLPGKNLSRSYEVLELAMMQTQLAAIGTSSLWGKETPCAVVTSGRVLCLQMLWCYDETIPLTEANTAVVERLRGQSNFTEQEVKLATDLLTAMKAPLEQSDLTSKSRDKMTAFVEAKLAGKTIEQDVSDGQRLEATADLMTTLRESVKVAKKPSRNGSSRKPAARRKTKTASKK